MTDNNNQNLPEKASGLEDWLSATPKALVPSSLKALDRLVGAGVNYPIALINRATAKVDAQTKAYATVEAAIAKSAGELAGADAGTIERALNVLVRKEYRKQNNREAIAKEAIEQITDDTNDAESKQNENQASIEDDWLNVFERFAEDSSSERMQRLWGRVLAGEIRQPGKFSLRTLRFLSEFSQNDAILFSEIAKYCVENYAIKSLVKPDDDGDISKLLKLESAGLISGASGLGLSRTMTFNQQGYGFVTEGKLALVLKGEPNSTHKFPAILLTPLGSELLTLVPDRDVKAIMRQFASAMKKPELNAAYIGEIAANPQRANFVEILWDDDKK